MCPAFCIFGTDRYGSSFSRHHKRQEWSDEMLQYALLFLVIAIVAGVLGFGGIAGAASGIAQILFFLFLAFLVISLIIGLFRRAS